MSDQRPHAVYATVDQDADVFWRIGCPYGGKGPRPCLLLEEADCPGYYEGDDCPLEDEGLSGDVAEFGHGHAVDGCAVIQYLEATSMGEGVAFSEEVGIASPTLVTIEWADNDGILLIPVRGAR